MKRIVIAVVLVATACASGGVHRVSGTRRSAPPPTSAGSGVSPSTTSAPRAPLPSFRLTSLAAEGRSQLWLLGFRSSCLSGGCRALLSHSTDGAAHWRSVALPALTISSGDAASRGVDEVLLADAQDGWLFGPDLWVTHDGARSWQHLDMNGRVIDLALSAASVWAVVERCTRAQVCTYQILRSSIRQNRFAPVAVPEPASADAGPPAIATDANAIAVLVSRKPSQTDDRDQLDFSSDDGATWRTRPAACLNELGGRLAIAPDLVWTMCPTGMSAAPAVSRSQQPFTPVNGPWENLPNSAALYAWSSDNVLLTSQARAYVSHDAGHHWQRVRTPSISDVWWWANIAFPTNGDGYALGQAPTFAILLRTKDGGRSWATLRGPA